MIEEKERTALQFFYDQFDFAAAEAYESYLKIKYRKLRVIQRKFQAFGLLVKNTAHAFAVFNGAFSEMSTRLAENFRLIGLVAIREKERQNPGSLTAEEYCFLRDNEPIRNGLGSESMP